MRKGPLISTHEITLDAADRLRADISDAKSVLQELQAIVPELPSVPVQPVIIASQEEPRMFDFYKYFPWFLPVHRYETPAQLLTELSGRVIEPSEAKALELRAAAVPTSLYLDRDSLDPQRLAHVQTVRVAGASTRPTIEPC